MLISVIVPTYHPQEYIYKCIDSIRKQTISVDKFRVIIVLNGDKEPYFSNISEYIKPDKNFICVYNTIKGVSAARNLGLDIANESDYIVFIDDDDYISEVYLENLYETIIIENADVVQANFKNDINGKLYDDYISLAYTKLQNKNKKYNIFYYRNFFSSVCAKIYSREVIGEFRFREDIKIAEDSIFLFAISKHIKTFKLADKTAIYYRNVREGSAIRSYRSKKEIIKNYFKKIKVFTKIYFSKPIEYNLMFYFSRLMAITKVLFVELKMNFR